MKIITKEEIAKGYDVLLNRMGLDVNFYNRVKNISPKLFGKVLDLGCGAGHLLEILQKKETVEGLGVKFYGLDISPVLIDATRKRNPNVLVKVGDADATEYSENEFNFIFMTEVLEHMLDYKKTLTEVYRIVNNGGNLIVTVPNRDWLQYDFYKEYIDKGEYQPVQDHYFCVNEIKDLLTNAGFKIIKIKGTDNLFYYGWKHEYIEQAIAFLFPFLYKKMKRLIILCEK